MRKWRGLLLALCVAAFTQSSLSIWMQELHMGALPGFTLPWFDTGGTGPSARLDPTDRPFIYRFVFRPGNALASFGVRNGDLLDLREASPGARFRWSYQFWWAGTIVDATVLRGDRDVVVPLTARWARLTWYGRLSYAGTLWLLVFAGILMWRRPNHPEAARSHCC